MVPALVGILVSFGFVAGIGAVLFRCAGRWDLPMFWSYLGVWIAGSVIGATMMDPGLVKERLRPGPGGKDYLSALLIAPVALGQFAAAGLDVGRFHWSDTVPLGVQVVGLLTVAGAFAVMLWASVVNRFFSSVIRIQTDRGHRVVTDGPYRIVRHPAYAAAPFFFVGTGVALGSWIAALIGVVLILPVIRRTAQEDRTLRAELDGYAAYAERVRYRLLPGVW